MPNPFETPIDSPASTFPSADVSPTANASSVETRVQSAIQAQDQKIDQMVGHLQNLTDAVNQLGRRSALPPQQYFQPNGPQPEVVRTSTRPTSRANNQQAPRIQTDRRPGYSAKKSASLPKFDLWKVFNLLSIVLLSAVLLVIFFNQRSSDSEAAQAEAAYQRAVASTRIVASTMATELESLTDDLRNSEMSKEDFDARIKEIAKQVIGNGAEAPLKALDEMKEWDAKAVANRTESASKGYRDIEATIKKLE